MRRDHVATRIFVSDSVFTQGLAAGTDQGPDAQSLDSAITISEKIARKTQLSLEEGCLEELRDSIITRVAHWGSTRAEDLGRLIFYDGRHFCSWPQKVEGTQPVDVRAPSLSNVRLAAATKENMVSH